MKKKKRDLLDYVGSDGELLVPIPTKRKRYSRSALDNGSSETSRVISLLLTLTAVIAFMLIIVGFFIGQSDTSSTSVAIIAPTLIETSPTLEADSPVVTLDLPPTWTPAPSQIAATQGISQGAPTLRPSSTATLTITPSLIPENFQVRVRANADWQGTGVWLDKEQFVEIEYINGEWSPWEEAENYHADGAGGYGCAEPDCLFIIYDYPYAALIGRVGWQGEFFKVGNYFSFIATQAGELFLRMNDPVTTDNSGEITVSIRVRD